MWKLQNGEKNDKQKGLVFDCDCVDADDWMRRSGTAYDHGSIGYREDTGYIARFNAYGHFSGIDLLEMGEILQMIWAQFMNDS